MQLSLRLRAIADMIPEGRVVVDIGCDHAFLDIDLTKRKKNKCIACDVRKSVLEIAQKNIAKFGFEKEIELIQSDGLETIDIPEGAVAVIAGMGTSTILSIFKNDKVKSFSQIIIQTNNDWALLRKKMSKKGFQLIEEKVVLEHNKYYVLMKWEIGKILYSSKQCFLGPLLIKKKESIPYYQYLLHQYQGVYSQIPKQHRVKRYQTRQKIRWLTKELKK